MSESHQFVSIKVNTADCLGRLCCVAKDGGRTAATPEAAINFSNLTKTAVVYGMGLAAIAIVALNGALKFATL